MNKGIHDLIQFTGIGGLLSLLGGIIGKAAGAAIARPCTLSCLNHLDGGGALQSFAYQNCLLTCPDPWLYAVYGAIPGVIIGVIWYLIKKKEAGTF
jgi:hypothetical protein